MLCLICGEEMRNVSRHVQLVHGYTPKEYYDKFLKKEDEGICSICGKPTKFYGITVGYKRTCSRSCNMRSVVKDILKDPERKIKWVQTISKNIKVKRH